MDNYSNSKRFNNIYFKIDELIEKNGIYSEYASNTHWITSKIHKSSLDNNALFSAFSVVRPQLVETFVKFVVKNTVQLLQYLLYHSEHTYN